MTTHKKAAGESGSIVQSYFSHKQYTKPDADDVAVVIGRMTGRKQRRVAAAYAKWLKRKAAQS